MYIIKHKNGKYIPNTLQSSNYIWTLIERDNLSFLSEKSKKVFQTKKGAEKFLSEIDDEIKRNDFSIIPLYSRELEYH